MEASSFPLFQIACVFKARINPLFNRRNNLKEVAGFKKQTGLYPYKNRSKTRSSLTFSFNVYPSQMLKYLRFV